MVIIIMLPVGSQCLKGIIYSGSVKFPENIAQGCSCKVTIIVIFFHLGNPTAAWNYHRHFSILINESEATGQCEVSL